jgi:glucokinase
LADNERVEQPRGIWSSVLATDGYVIGVEIGVPRSRVTLARVDSERVDDISRTSLARESAEETLTVVFGLIDELCERNELTAEKLVRIGIAFAGPVDTEQGIVLVSHRAPGWENLPLRQLFEDRYNVPTIVDNDANMAALGEATSGGAKGERDVLYIHIGEGVGGGLILGGHIYHGASGTAGEVGHMVVEPGGPLCSCGGRGHLEAMISRPAIVDRAKSMIGASLDESVMIQLADGNLDNLDVATVFAASAQDDPVGARVVDDVLRYLTIGISNLVNILNPRVVVVGGPVAEVGATLFGPLKEMVRDQAMAAPGRTVRIVPALLGVEATISGAIALALYSLQY